MTTAAEAAKAIQAALDSHPAGWGKSLEAVAGKDAGIAFVGAVLDGEHYPYIQVDTADYYADEAALPIARLIAAANPKALRALLTERTALLAAREQDAMAVSKTVEELERLRAVNKALEVDARRYRWLRDLHIGNEPAAINLQPAKKVGLDAAVDAAIAAQQEKQG